VLAQVAVAAALRMRQQETELAAVVAALAAVGLTGLRRRDLA
jgi:hypothetical protein